MTVLDILMLLLGVILVIFFAWQRMVRALFSLIVIWAAALVSALLYQGIAFRMQALTGTNVILWEGVFFLGLFIMTLVIGYLLVLAAFPVTDLPRIGILDYAMGALVGVIAAALVVSMLINGWGVMVREVWPDQQAFAQWYGPFAGSALRPWTRQIVSIFRVLFVPFFRTLPPALYPL